MLTWHPLKIVRTIQCALDSLRLTSPNTNERPHTGSFGSIRLLKLVSIWLEAGGADVFKLVLIVVYLSLSLGFRGYLLLSLLCVLLSECLGSNDGMVMIHPPHNLLGRVSTRPKITCNSPSEHGIYIRLIIYTLIYGVE